MPLCAIHRGPLCFYKCQFVYFAGSSALPGIYKFLSDRVSGGKCKWKVNRAGVASPHLPQGCGARALL